MDRDHILAGLRERILAFATSRVSRDYAEDLTQEVLIVLQEKSGGVTELTELVPLAFQVLRFKMLDAHRKSFRRGEYNQESVDDLPLTDPAVRRRLLQTLNQASPSVTGGALSWLDWFRRPANLALAGGLAVAVFTVVPGTKVYQDSLKQTAQTVATEDTSLAPQRPPIPPPASQPAPHEVTEPQSKAKENVEPSASAPSPPASAPAPMQAPAGEATIGIVSPAVSARALFYGESIRPDTG